MEVATKIKLTVKEERFVAYGLPPTRAAKVSGQQDAEVVELKKSPA